MIKIRNSLYRKLKKSFDPDLEKVYKRFRSKLNGLLAKAQRDHYSRLLEMNKNNMKKKLVYIKRSDQ